MDRLGSSHSLKKALHLIKKEAISYPKDLKDLIFVPN